MWKHNQEAIDAVEEFNEKVEDTIGSDQEFSSDHYMVVESNGTQTLIRFMGVVLWSSEDDERKFNDEGYEPLLGFLQKRIKKELERFTRVLVPKTKEDK